MIRFKILLGLAVLALSIGTSFTKFSHASEPVISTQKKGADVVAAVSLASVSELAGLKYVVKYDSGKLSYKSIEKSEYTKNFLSVVNDKVANQLTVIMASATGFSAANAALFSLIFNENSQDSSSSADIRVVSCEMMSEKLSAIPCTAGR